MNINGCFYDDARVELALHELEIAVYRHLKPEAPLRRQFDFLFGLIIALIDEAEGRDDKQDEINTLRERIDAVRSAVERGLENLGESAPDDLDDSVIRLIELAQTRQESTSELTSAGL